MKIHYPIHSLVPFIELMWEVNHFAEKNMVHKIIPEGISEIIINHGDAYWLSTDNRKEQSVDNTSLFIMRREVNYLRQGQQAKALGIRLRPYSLYILLGEPISGFKDLHYNLKDLIPALDRDINELKVIHFSKLEKILVEYFNRYPERRNFLIEKIYREIEIKKGVTSVGYLSIKFDVTYKTMERLFDRYMGIPPKLYIRFRRLHFALNEINEATSKPDFLSIVAKYGFHDQAHFIREFSSLTGVTPLQFYSENDSLQKFYQ